MRKQEQSPEEMNNKKLYENQQAGIGTDCSFVFQHDDGSTETVHGHKAILSTASEVFEANFKEEWKGNEPISITSMDCVLFKRLIRAIYINDVQFESLEDAGELYEAAHFYQIEGILDILREVMCQFCLKNYLTAFSRLINTGWKYQDIKLISFGGKYFARYANGILKDPDFMKCSPDSVNFLYQIDDFSSSFPYCIESHFFKALEKYVTTNSTPLTALRPAIGSLCFSQLKSYIKDTPVLTEIEKNSLLGMNSLKFSYLSKSKKRNIITLPDL